MRAIATVFAAALLIPILAQLAVAGESDEARAIVDKAIEAAGGRDNLKKFQTVTFEEKGTYYGMGEGLPYTSKGAFDFPDKSYMEIVGLFTMVLNGDKGWTKSGETITDMPAEQVKGQMEAHYAGWVATLLPLADDAFQLKKLDDAKVEDKAASVVQVSHKGHGDLKLYFDKETGLLAKSEFTAFDAEQGKDALYENIYQEYKEIDGAKMTSKMLMNRDGKKFVESEIISMKPAKDIDKMFEKP